MSKPYDARITAGELIKILQTKDHNEEIRLSVVESEYNYHYEAYLRNAEPSATKGWTFYASSDDDTAEESDRRKMLIASAKAKLSPEELKALQLS